MKTQPVPIRKTTVTQLARGLNDLHDCLNDTQRRVMLLMVAMGLPENATLEDARRLTPSVKTHLSVGQLAKIAGSVLGSIAGLFLLLRFLGAIFPTVWHAVMTVN